MVVHLGCKTFLLTSLVCTASKGVKQSSAYILGENIVMRVIFVILFLNNCFVVVVVVVIVVVVVVVVVVFALFVCLFVCLFFLVVVVCLFVCLFVCFGGRLLSVEIMGDIYSHALRAAIQILKMQTMNEASQYSKTSSTVKHTELFHPVGYIPPVTPFQILPLRNFHHSSSGKPLTVLKEIIYAAFRQRK